MGISIPRPELPLDAVKVTVVALSGSLREGSYTTMALRTALRGAAEAGANVRLIDLRDG
jgi:multimeric flavodoxin WrbA